MKEEIERAVAGAFAEFLESALTGDAGKTTGITSHATGPLVTEDVLDKLRTEAEPIPDAEDSTPTVAAKFRREETAIDFDTPRANIPSTSGITIPRWDAGFTLLLGRPAKKLESRP